MNNKGLILKLTFLIVFIIFGCKSENTELNIIFSKDLKTIVVKNIDNKTLSQIKSFSKDELKAFKMFRVYKIQNIENGEIVEQELDGELILIGDYLNFKPVKSFVKGDSYLIRSWLNLKFGDVEMLLKGKFNDRLKPQEQILMF